MSSRKKISFNLSTAYGLMYIFFAFFLCTELKAQWDEETSQPKLETILNEAKKIKILLIHVNGSEKFTAYHHNNPQLRPSILNITLGELLEKNYDYITRKFNKKEDPKNPKVIHYSAIIKNLQYFKFSNPINNKSIKLSLNISSIHTSTETKTINQNCPYTDPKIRVEILKYNNHSTGTQKVTTITKNYVLNITGVISGIDDQKQIINLLKLSGRTRVISEVTENKSECVAKKVKNN